MDILTLDDQLNAMIIEGRSVDAFLRFYSEDVISQENDEPERFGREVWMRARQEVAPRCSLWGGRHMMAGDQRSSWVAFAPRNP